MYIKEIVLLRWVAFALIEFLNFNNLFKFYFLNFFQSSALPHRYKYSLLTWLPCYIFILELCLLVLLLSISVSDSVNYLFQ